MKELLVGIEENKLLRCITVIIYCMQEEMLSAALLFATETIENSKRYDITEYYGEVKTESILSKFVPYVVTFSLQYAEDEARNNFYELMKSYTKAA